MVNNQINAVERHHIRSRFGASNAEQYSLDTQICMQITLSRVNDLSLKLAKLRTESPIVKTNRGIENENRFCAKS